MTPRLASALVAIAAAGLLAQVAEAQPARTHLLIVVGLGGEAEYAADFAAQADAAFAAAGSVGATATRLVGDAARGEGIREALAAIAAKAGAADAFGLLLIGHGSYDGEHYRFNVPGADPTAAKLAAWLDPIAAQRQLVVAATSASGAAVAPLRKPGRTVMAATKSGRERNAVVFGRFWADALAAPRADLDKNRLIDADEAFAFATESTAEHYAARQRLATEHALREGPPSRFALAALRVDAAPALDAPLDPELAGLIARADELAARVDALRERKAALAEEDYLTRLHALLVDLALAEKKLRERREAAASAAP